MGGDFIVRRIAQDAFDPVTLSDEVVESGVSSLKHEWLALVSGLLFVSQG
jgi:hypothetical protein